jgi:hypothetical protein
MELIKLRITNPSMRRLVAKQHEKPAKRWTARLIRKKMEVLGIVYAPDQEAARAAAITEFKLTAEQAKRLVLDEWS